MKIEVSTSEKDVLELFESLDTYTKQSILNQFTFDELIGSVEEHLKGESEYWSWDTSGYTFGERLRKAIANIQGTEPELIKDYERKIRMLESDVKKYKQYYDWYFRIYLFDRPGAGDSLIQHVEKLVGKPK